MRFAYLVMAHHRFDVLEKLLEDLDDERNDIFLHIDKKTKDVPYESLKAKVKNAKLVFVKRIKIYWGSYSQIACILNMLKTATQYGYHDYYHLMVGVEFPLKSQDYIYNFFDNNRGKEFIGYDTKEDYSDRLKYYSIWGKYARSNTIFGKTKNYIDIIALKMQKIIGLNRLKHESTYYKKGYANWSITHSLALYVITLEEKIRKSCIYTRCADEIFLHTIVYHSPYYQNVYDKLDEYNSVMRWTTWDDPTNSIHFSDLETLKNSDKLFARKFDDSDAVAIIDALLLNRI